MTFGKQLEILRDLIALRGNLLIFDYEDNDPNIWPAILSGIRMNAIHRLGEYAHSPVVLASLVSIGYDLPDFDALDEDIRCILLNHHAEVAIPLSYARTFDSDEDIRGLSLLELNPDYWRIRAERNLR